MTSADLSLYLVTDAPERYSGSLLENVEAALAGGVTVVQYRASTSSRRSQYETARALQAMLERHKVPLIVNDQVDLALAVNADGVHVGQGDLPADVVRRLVGPGKWIGLSITEESQLDAVPVGYVDYLGIGPVFPTVSKDDAAPALGLRRLAAMTARAGLPVVAIGGINLENAASVFAAGASGIAVVSAFSRSNDPASVARALKESRHPSP